MPRTRTTSVNHLLATALADSKNLPLTPLGPSFISGDWSTLDLITRELLPQLPVRPPGPAGVVRQRRDQPLSDLPVQPLDLTLLMRRIRNPRQRRAPEFPGCPLDRVGEELAPAVKPDQLRHPRPTARAPARSRSPHGS